MKTEDNRQFLRHIVPTNDFQIDFHYPNIPYEPVNLSLGGLAFRYTCFKGKKLEIKSVNIIAKGSEHFYALKLTCRMIYNISQHEKDPSSDGIEERQCGLNFVGITESQLTKLELLTKDICI